MFTDENLYEHFWNGEKIAADELVHRHGDILVLFLNSYVKDIHEAEDLMIEAFSLMFAKKRPVDRTGSFRAYLYRTGRNLVLRHKRKNRRVLIGMEQMAFEPADEQTGEKIMFLNEQNRSLYIAMEQLKPEYREALYLVYFEDMKYAEAAEVMRKSVSQITTLVSRGKRRIKNILEKEGFVYEDR